MLARGQYGSNAIPSTKTEVLRFRAAGGASDDGYTNNQHLERGLKNRYNVEVETVLRYPLIWTKLRPGQGAALFGILARFPYSHHLRRWDPSYRGGHVVFVERLDSTNRVWWMDPLAPAASRIGSRTVIYRGEWASASELQTFLGGNQAVRGRTALITSLASVAKVETEPMLLLFETEYTLASGAVLYQHPDLTATKIGTTNEPHLVQSVGTPYRGTAIDASWRAIHWSTGAPDGSAPSDRCVYVLASNVSPQ